MTSLEILTTEVIVLRYFVSREITKSTYCESDLVEISAIPDDDEFKSRLKSFASANDTGCPVYTWTGLNQNDRRVSRWVKRDKVDVAEFFSKGINPIFKTQLDSVRGNLVQLALLVQKDEILANEFDLSRTPSFKDEQIIIGVKKSSPNHDGTIELIDGAHRFVSMVTAGVREVPAYLAIVDN